MSSNAQAQWTSPPNFGVSLGSDITSVLSSTTSALNVASSVLSGVEGIVNIVSKFLGNGNDILGSIINGGLSIVNSQFQDILSFGGSYIVIHPWNVPNPTTINILEGMTPSKITGKKQPFLPTPAIHIKALTPRQALKNLVNSFSNTEDLNRPQWTQNVKVSGFGVIITAQNSLALGELIRTINMFLSDDDLLDLQTKIEKSVSEIRKASSDFNDVVSSQSYVDLSNLPNDPAARTAEILRRQAAATTVDNALNSLSILTPSIAQEFDEADLDAAERLADILQDTGLTSMHWTGLSVRNFPFFQQIIGKIEAFIDLLSTTLDTGESIIAELAKAIINRIKTLIATITEITDVINSIETALNSGGIYVFTIPQDFGGNQHIIDCINNSITSSATGAAANLVAGLDNNTFTALFFAATSTTFDFNAWWNAYETFAAQINAEIWNTEGLEQVTISPDFSSSSFYYNIPIKFSVISRSTTPVWFTYKITDSQGNVVASGGSKISFNISTDLSPSGALSPGFLSRAHSMLAVNGSPVSVTITKPVNPLKNATYTLSVEAFDFMLYDKTYKTSFPILIANAVPLNIIYNANGGSGAVPIDATTYYLGNTATILGSNTLSLRGYTFAGWGISQTNPVSIGNTYTFTVEQNLTLYAVWVANTTSTSTLTSLTVNGLPFPTHIYSPSFPATVKFDFIGILYLFLEPNGPWISYNLPASISLVSGTYQCRVWTPSTGLSNISILSTLVKDLSSIVC